QQACDERERTGDPVDTTVETHGDPLLRGEQLLRAKRAYACRHACQQDFQARHVDVACRQNFSMGLCAPSQALNATSISVSSGGAPRTYVGVQGTRFPAGALTGPGGLPAS